MDTNNKEVIAERIYYLLCSSYQYLYETGKKKGHWEDLRGTALAGIALDLKEVPNSIWLRLIRSNLLSNQITEGEAIGSWSEEIWDTAMCLIALKSFEISSKDPIIKTPIDWIASLYQVNTRNNWHDEPWETCWAIIAILTTGIIPQNLDIKEPIRWLLGFQEDNGRIIAPHYTAYYLIIWDKLQKTMIDTQDAVFFDNAKDLSMRYLRSLLHESSDDVLWSGEAWSNGQILWSLCLVDHQLTEDTLFIDKVLNWFEKNQGKQGNWLDIEDTASAIIGLHALLEVISKSSPYLQSKSIKQTLQKRLPCPDIYIKRPLIEQHKETGGISINLNNRFIKTLAIIGALAAGLTTVVSLFDFFKKMF
jgi:hypothetical protein